MKFNEKLLSLRKLNNMSQEQLADKLGVSRQAVSKWESGTSIPDMEKMMQLCKILNCNLDELVDDGAWGTNAKEADVKPNWSIYYKEVLDFITRSINMFWSMRLVEKVKCILEMGFLTFFLYLVWMIIGNTIYSCFFGILNLLPDMAHQFLYSICSVVYRVFGIIASVILLVHIFKIRYLDYFITIEDINTKEKSIEEPIEEKEKIVPPEQPRKFMEPKKNKIIIRDPKHSTYSFFGILAKIVIWFIKIMLALIAIPCVICFVIIAFLALCAIWYLQNGIFFIGILLTILGTLMINYIVLNMIYNFIFELKYPFKKIFLIIIIGFFAIGSGAGISFCTYLTFDKISYSEETEITTEEISYEEDLVLPFLYYDNTIIVEDNTSSNIKITIEHMKYLKPHLENDTHFITSNPETFETITTTYQIYDYYFDYEDPFDTINNILNMIKQKQRIDLYDEEKHTITITASSDTINKLKANHSQYYN